MSTDAPVRHRDSEHAARTERERETAADVRLYVEIGLTPVTCASCGVEAHVKKNSRKHTSVQWTTPAVAACPEIAAARAADPNTLVLGCARLKASIDDAVRAGAIVVPDEDGPGGA
jgi:hypothetical protein